MFRKYFFVFVKFVGLSSVLLVVCMLCCILTRRGYERLVGTDLPGWLTKDDLNACSELWIGAILGALAIPFIKDVLWPALKERFLMRSLWCLSDPYSCTMVISCHSRYTWAERLSNNTENRPTWKQEDTAVPKDAVLYHYKNDTGEGQVRALTCLVSSLYAAYGHEIDWGQLCFSNKLSGCKVDFQHTRDLILLGGPSTNEYTKAVLDGLSYLVSLCSHGADIGLTITKRDGFQKHWYGIQYYYDAQDPLLTPKNRKYYQQTLSKRVTLLDHAIIIRKTKNHSSKCGVIYVFAGCTTYGTYKAAEYFCGDFSKHSKMRGMKRKDYIAVVEIRRKVSPLEKDEVRLVDVFNLEE